MGRGYFSTGVREGSWDGKRAGLKPAPTWEGTSVGTWERWVPIPRFHEGRLCARTREGRGIAMATRFLGSASLRSE